MKKIISTITKRNLFYFLQFCILFFGVSFPFWQTTEVFEIYHPLWIIVPGLIFAMLFSVAFGSIFDLRDSRLRLVKKVIGYWLGGGFILFFVILILMGINYFTQYDQMYVTSAALAVSAVLIAYSYYVAKRIIIQPFTIISPKITQSVNIIQISDIHVGSNGVVEVERMLKKMDKLNYDFVVITGDLVDEDYASKDALELLDTIEKPVYYITGNHEYYLRHADFSEFINQTTIIDINDKKVTLGEIDILGIDEKSDAQTILSNLGVTHSRFSLGLMHEPDFRQMKKASDAGIDLMLSGHTHSGQIFPFTLLVKARYRFLSGTYLLGNMDIHVSQGTSTWGPKMRLGTRNEITHITLLPESK